MWDLRHLRREERRLGTHALDVRHGVRQLRDQLLLMCVCESVCVRACVRACVCATATVSKRRVCRDQGTSTGSTGEVRGEYAGGTGQPRGASTALAAAARARARGQGRLCGRRTVECSSMDLLEDCVSSCSLTTSVERWSSTLVPLAWPDAAASASLARTCALTHALTSKSCSPKALKVSSIPAVARRAPRDGTRRLARAPAPAGQPPPVFSLSPSFSKRSTSALTNSSREQRPLRSRERAERTPATDSVCAAGSETAAAMSKKRVAIVGSGNWGCAIAKIVANNAARHNHLHEEVGTPARRVPPRSRAAAACPAAVPSVPRDARVPLARGRAR